VLASCVPNRKSVIGVPEELIVLDDDPPVRDDEPPRSVVPPLMPAPPVAPVLDDDPPVLDDDPPVLDDDPPVLDDDPPVLDDELPVVPARKRAAMDCSAAQFSSNGALIAARMVASS
jgi:hypothetical protein